MLLSHPEEKKLILTLKKTLVGSKLPVLASYAAAKPGLVTHGVVVCAREFGCIVKFYNDVKGLVPRNELGSEPIRFPEKVFYEGQVSNILLPPPPYGRMGAGERLASDGTAPSKLKQAGQCTL